MKAYIISLKNTFNRKLIFYTFLILVVIFLQCIDTKYSLIKDNRSIIPVIDTQKYNYSNPVVPDGFNKVDTYNAKWINVAQDYIKGLVIQDNLGNQFVWVPVFGNIKYEKWCTLGLDYNLTYDVKEDELIKDSINKYGGFYVGRYESAFSYDNSNLRVTINKSKSKMVSEDWSNQRNDKFNQYLWNYINYYDAKKYSQEMAITYGYNDKVITDLMSGSDWDTIIRWLELSSKLDILDSISYGNYYNSDSIKQHGVLQVSGYSDKWMINNIYDMAGNLAEWTDEKYNDKYIVRGGFYHDNGKEKNICNRQPEDNKSYVNVGFRVVLYVK